MKTKTRVIMLVTAMVATALLTAGQANGSVTGPPAGILAQDAPVEEGALSARQEENLYARATQALDGGRYAEAIRLFQQLVDEGRARQDAAMYWIAYAQNRNGNPTRALQTIARLRTAYAESPWLDDAEYLEAEIRGASGQTPTPEETEDEELRMYALNSLMHVDAERAVPLLEGILRGDENEEMKERALFILMQGGAEGALDIVADVARTAEDEDLRETALTYIGMFGGEESLDLLEEIYAETEDPDAKEAILYGFMRAGDRERLLEVAREEDDDELRISAIHLLSMSGGSDELWSLYETEESIEAREAILHSMMRTGETGRLIQVLRSEERTELAEAALHALSMMGGGEGEDDAELVAVLVQTYRQHPDPELREAAIHALWRRGEATTLIQLFEEEEDPELRRQIVELLSMMDSEEAVEFLIDLIER